MGKKIVVITGSPRANGNSAAMAAAFVKGKIDAEKAYQAALIEEIWQAESWGKDALAEERRSSIYQELADLEAYLRETPV